MSLLKSLFLFTTFDTTQAHAEPTDGSKHRICPHDQTLLQISESGITMGMLKEFKEFAVRGNVVDMAVGIIIGAAFSKIVSSLVKDVVMPPIGLLLGKVDFSQLSIVLREKTDTADAVTINYGIFLNTVIDFVIVAFVIFLVIRQMNKMKRQEEPKPETTKACPFCKSTIDLHATRCPQCTSELTEPAV